MSNDHRKPLPDPTRYAAIVTGKVACLTPHNNRVRAATFCPRCMGVKDAGLLVCWPCNRRLKAAYDGGYGLVFEKKLADLDIYLFAHSEVQAQAWLGAA